jgi:hypothetical protein
VAVQVLSYRQIGNLRYLQIGHIWWAIMAYEVYSDGKC